MGESAASTYFCSIATGTAESTMALSRMAIFRVWDALGGSKMMDLDTGSDMARVVEEEESVAGV